MEENREAISISIRNKKEVKAILDYELQFCLM
jgi:hypothetical protein